MKINNISGFVGIVLVLMLSLSNLVLAVDYDLVKDGYINWKDLGGGSVSIDGSSAASFGGNTIKTNSPYNLINQTGSIVKAKFNYWDHTTVADVLNNDVDPLGAP